MEQNSKKPITLKSLYSSFIDCAVSGCVYINYQIYGSSYLINPKHRLLIDEYAARGYIRVQLDTKHNWIGKYDQT